MKRPVIYLGVALTVALVAPAPSHADPIEFDFSFYNIPDTISGSGTLSATPNGDGSYLAVGGSVSVSIADTGTFANNPSVPDGQSVNLDLTLLTSPSGYPATILVPGIIGVPGFTWDNLIFPTSTSQVDLDGLLFTDGVSYLNLANLEGEPFFDTYAIYDPDSTDLGNDLYFDSMTFAITPTATPEPSAVELVGVGVGIFAWRKRRRTA